MSLIAPNVRENNKVLLDLLQDKATCKQAADEVRDYLRIRNREDGMTGKILPRTNITSANLDRQVDTPDPVVVNDIEAESAGAQTIPFGVGPQTVMIDAQRYAVVFKRIESKRYQQDINRLLTWNMDIKEQLKDLLLKDIQYQEDAGFMGACKRIVGACNTVNELIDACQWTTQGPLDRVSFAQARKGLEATNRNLNATVGLVNCLTVWDLPKLNRNEVGGDLAERMFTEDNVLTKVMGLRLVVTIKKELVQNNDLWQFADPQYLGDYLVLDDIILSTETINYWIEFFGYECIGMAIKNVAALCRTSFTGTATDWNTGESTSERSYYYIPNAEPGSN